MSWEPCSCSHLFCTSVFEGININHPSPELLIFYHNWNRRAILAEGREVQKKNSALCLARPKFRLQQYERTRVMLLVNNIISYRLFLWIPFLCFCWWTATAERKDQGYTESSCSSSLELGWQNEKPTCWNENPFSLGMWWCFLILRPHWTRTAVIHFTPSGFCQ